MVGNFKGVWLCVCVCASPPPDKTPVFFLYFFFYNFKGINKKKTHQVCQPVPLETPGKIHDQVCSRDCGCRVSIEKKKKSLKFRSTPKYYSPSSYSPVRRNAG